MATIQLFILRHLWSFLLNVGAIHTRFGQWVEQRFLATVAAQMGAKRLHGTEVAPEERAERDTLPSVDVDVDELDDDHPSGIGAATEPPRSFGAECVQCHRPARFDGGDKCEPCHFESVKGVGT